MLDLTCHAPSASASRSKRYHTNYLFSLAWGHKRKWQNYHTLPDWHYTILDFTHLLFNFNPDSSSLIPQPRGQTWTTQSHCRFLTSHIEQARRSKKQRLFCLQFFLLPQIPVIVQEQSLGTNCQSSTSWHLFFVFGATYLQHHRSVSPILLDLFSVRCVTATSLIPPYRQWLMALVIAQPHPAGIDCSAQT